MSASGIRAAKRERTAPNGFIVVAVLWMLSALAILAGVYAIYVNQTALATVTPNERVQAEQAAIGGLELAIYRRALPPPANEFQFKIGDATVSIRFQTENGRIDINVAPKEVLAGLMTSLGMARGAADALGDRIVAWRAPTGATAAEAETSLYHSGGKPYGPRLAPFQHVNEVGLVLGFPPEILERALPYLTVYSGYAEINVRDAAPEVVAALPSMTPDVLALLLDQRSTVPLDVLRTRLGSAARYATIDASRASRAMVEVAFGGARRYQFEMVVLPLDRDPEPFRILYWRDELDGPWPSNSRSSLQ